MKVLQARARELRMPVLIQHGTADSLVPIAPARAIYQHLGNSKTRTLHAYEGLELAASHDVRYAVWEEPAPLASSTSSPDSETRPTRTRGGEWLFYEVGEVGSNADLWMAPLVDGRPGPGRPAVALNSKADDVSPCSDDRQYVYQATSDVNGGTVTIGYPYSLLEWCAEPHSSWSLPVDVGRVPSTQTAQEVGAEQIKALANTRKAYFEALDIIAADGKYGNAGFLRSVKGLRRGPGSFTL